MAQIPDSGCAVQSFRGSNGFLVSLALTCAVVVLLLPTARVQAQSTGTSNPIGKNKPTAASLVPLQEVDLPPVVPPPPPPPTVEQKPPQPLVVGWDGKRLTIDADNSRLSDILVAVRQRIGASIEIAAAAAGERVFIHLGPGPPRDIITSLLYGTPFDYILEAEDDDPETLRRVVVTARGLGDSSGDVVVAGTTDIGVGSGADGSTPAVVAHDGQATDTRTRLDGVRMMRGWVSPGKTSSQANAEAVLAAQQSAAQESTSAQESAAAPDAGTAQDSTASVDAVESAKASNSSLSKSESDDPSEVGHAIQNMTRMFEQRRQIQAQQNQAPPPSSN